MPMNSDEELSHTCDQEQSIIEDDCTNVSSPRSGRTIKRQKTEHEAHFEMPPSPPSYVTMRQLTEAANAFYNMSLAHEITIDSDFRIEMYDPPEDSVEHVVKETMHRAFWDLLRSSLEADPPDYEPALRLLREIKQSLNGLVLPSQKKLQQLIEITLDLDEAETQIQQTGYLNLETYADQVISIMRQFCAPVRDQEVEDLRKITDIVEAFRNAFILLEKMHMDLANFTIAQMRPYIRQQAVSYERSKFADFLTAQRALGIDGLRRTREWIQLAYEQLLTQTTSIFPSTNDVSLSITSQPSYDSTESSMEPNTMISNGELLVTPNNILREAYLALLTWPHDKEWPETVIMDQQRLMELGVQLDTFVTLTSLVLTVCNHVASNISQLIPASSDVNVDASAMLHLKRLVCQTGWTVLRNAVLNTLDERATILGEKLTDTLERWAFSVLFPNQKDSPPVALPNTQNISSCTYPKVSDDLKTTLMSQVSQMLRRQHPVYALMHKRALGFLRVALSSRPPESLPLPPGFSILLSIDQDIEPGTSETQKPTAVPHMMTGIGSRGNSSMYGDDTLIKRSSKSETLGLSHLASRLFPLVAHNRHVFGPKYAEIIQAILFPQQTSPHNKATAATNMDS